MKILAIDDQPDNLTILKAVLREALPECELLTALTGANGLDLAQAEDPDVILLDIVMPGMDGYEFCRLLKADEWFRAIPIVFLTALQTGRENRIKALNVGADAFLAKPPDEQELVAQIRAMAKVKVANRLQQMQKEELAAVVFERNRELEAELAARKQVETRDRLAQAVLELLNCSESPEETIRSILHLIKQHTGYSAVGIRLRRGDDFPYFVAHGFSDGHLLTENTLLAHDAQGGICRDKDGAIALECSCGLVISGRADPANASFTLGGSFWSNKLGFVSDHPTEQDPRVHPRNCCTLDGFLSVALIPLRSGQEIIGLLQINDRQPDQFTLESIQFFESLSNSIGIALTRLQAVAERDKLEIQLRQAAKMEAIGHLAGGVAHDFNNKLQIISLTTEMLQAMLPPENPILPDLDTIQQAAKESANLTKQLLAFSRQEAIEPVAIDVKAAIVGSLKMLRRLIGENIQLNYVQEPDVGHVFMDPVQLDQILANLVLNARDAIAVTGHITITAIPQQLLAVDVPNPSEFMPPGEYVRLTVRDDGMGMTPEIQAHIFEPFFTTKGVGKGTGLGLATVYGVVKQNHGTITVQSVPGQGTVFTIYLPRLVDAVPIATQNIAVQSPTSRETVLLVEDERRILELVQKILTQQGYTVLSANTPAEALRQCASYQEPIHLLLTDVIMPSMSGLDLAERLQKLWPDLHVLYMSGYTKDIMKQHGRLPENFSVLKKPFTSAVLAQRVHAALNAPPKITGDGGAELDRQREVAKRDKASCEFPL